MVYTMVYISALKYNINTECLILRHNGCHVGYILYMCEDVWRCTGEHGHVNQLSVIRLVYHFSVYNNVKLDCDRADSANKSQCNLSWN